MKAMKGSQAFTQSVVSRTKLAAAMLLGFALAAGGGTSFWTNTAGSAFSFVDGANWDTGTAPGVDDNAVFNQSALNGTIHLPAAQTMALWNFQAGDITLNGAADSITTLNGAGTCLYMAPTSAVTVRLKLTSGRIYVGSPGNTGKGFQMARNAWPSGSAHAGSRAELIIDGPAAELYFKDGNLLLGDNAPANVVITNGGRLSTVTTYTGDQKLYWKGRNGTIFHVSGQGSVLRSVIWNLGFAGITVYNNYDVTQEAFLLFDNGAVGDFRLGIKTGLSSKDRSRVRVTGAGTTVTNRAAPLKLAAGGTDNVGILEILDGGRVIAGNENGSDLNIGTFAASSVTGIVTIAGQGSRFESPYNRSVTVLVGSSGGAYGRLTLRDGGALIATNAVSPNTTQVNVWKGVVSLEGGTMKVDHLTATNAAGVLRFVMGATGSGTITLKGNLTVNSSTKLVVDDAGYAAPGEVELIRYGAQVGALAPGNITVTGSGSVFQDTLNTRIVYVPPPLGTVIAIR